MRSIFFGLRITERYYARYWAPGCYSPWITQNEAREKFLEFDLDQPPLKTGELFSPDGKGEPFQIGRVFRIGNRSMGYETNHVISREEELGSLDNARRECKRMMAEYKEEREKTHESEMGYKYKSFWQKVCKKKS